MILGFWKQTALQISLRYQSVPLPTNHVTHSEGWEGGVWRVLGLYEGR